jgi:hypothetical protein
LHARATYLALAVVTAVTIFVETVITRVFSLTLWYHFGFVAVSLAMLGMGAGAMWVYLRRAEYDARHCLAHMCRLMVWFGVTIVGAYVLNLGICFTPSFQPAAMVGLLLIVSFWAVPFLLSGMIVSIALTRTELPVGKLYAVDLIGAAVGCLAVQPALAWAGPPAGLAASAVAVLLAAWVLRRDIQWPASAPAPRLMAPIILTVLFLLVCAARPGLFAPRWVKGRWDHAYDKSLWNAISRVSVWPEETPDKLFGWGFGNKFPADKYPAVPYRVAETDAFIHTWLIKYDGNPERYSYVNYDVVNFGYRLRTGGSAAIIGSGGGLDVLAALVMGQREVYGIELNPILNDLLRGDYADFTGRIAYDPRVKFITAEARNWIEQSGRQFDVIQTTFIDTQAATAAGAFALAENTLYTTEAWRAYMRHLTPTGIFTISRWHWNRDPMESYRLTTLARSALQSSGQTEPGRCVAILANIEDEELRKVTLALSPSPLSPEDCRKVRQVADECGFEVLYSPTERNEPYAQLLDPARAGEFERQYHYNITPPSDDKPYFFFMVRPRDLIAPHKFRQIWLNTHFPMHMSVLAVFTFLFLGSALTAGAIGLTLAPLYMREGKGTWRRGDLAAAGYFAAIGVAFMLVEMGIMQRTGIALGHPLYGLQVTLVSLLLGSGIGSLLSSLLGGSLQVRARTLMVLLGCATTVTALSVGPLASALGGAPQIVRLLAVGGLVFLVGLFMGTAFPMGLSVARERGREDVLPWLWGLNGVCSVIGAFAATVLGILLGARVTTLTGAGVYWLACLIMWALTARRPAKA